MTDASILRRHFEALLDLPPGDREAHLASLDLSEDQRDQLRRMIAHDEAATSEPATST